MVGLLLENIGKKKSYLEKAKKRKIFNNVLNLSLNFDFWKTHPSKVKNENHQNSMCDSLKEPHGLTNHKSEEKMKKY